MRNTIKINDAWSFKKDASLTPPTVDGSFAKVELPHSFNAVDGMDGSKPWRGSTWYIRPIELASERRTDERVFVEVGAASLLGEVFVNGEKVCEHKGGYARFRADITDFLNENGANLLQIRVDNSAFGDIYPQMADFTFYGGLTRGVKLIRVPSCHFALGYYGSDGVSVTPKPSGDGADIEISAWVEGCSDEASVCFELFDADGAQVGEVWRPAGESVSAAVHLDSAHRWSTGDPYLYTARARLMVHNETLDEVSVRFGVRDFSVDPQRGFILNGKSTVLRGVAKHGDRLYKGTAVSREDLVEDAELIRELGANTVRCAHYQHPQEFYDLCDEYGLVVWAEIPYISVQADDPNAHAVAIEMMKELVIQNYNHPSICFWGLSNEITMGGADRPRMVENHRELNELVKSLDKTRLTTMAHIGATPGDHPLHDIPDVESYNHYFGWYTGSMEDNGPWLDEYHAEHPDRALGLSEYGAEGIVSYHNEHPSVSDYSEEYQALYHAHLCDLLDARPWVWASHVWNMFDFGCSARDEGGVKGRNNKGLVTVDRRVRKDSFYVCKAHWSREPFVHLCGKRYACRSGSTTRVMVCTNQPNAELLVNGKHFGSTDGAKVKVFENVPLTDGTNLIKLVAGGLCDTLSVEKVASEPSCYTVPANPMADARKAAAMGVRNWFEGKLDAERATPAQSDEHYSVKDSMKTLLANADCRAIISELLPGMAGESAGGMAEMARSMSLEQNLGFVGGLPDGGLELLEAQLNRIKK